MTLHAVTVPNWGLSMEEGTLSRWLVAEGTTIAAGDEIADIETSKIANVLEAPASGVLRRQIAAEGEVHAVATLIGVIADADESEQALDAFVAERSTLRAAVDAAPARAEPETISVDGKPVRFLTAPAHGEARGDSLVLVHGFGGDYRNWMFNQAALAVDRDVHALDLPGHGGSSKDVGDGSLATLADRLLAWLDARGLDRVHVVGHSMGAAVALGLALAHPERVRSVVGIAGGGWGGTLDRGYVEGFLAAPRRKDLKPVIELLFADPTLVSREMLDDLVAYKRIDGVPEALRLLIDYALDPSGLDALHARLGDVVAPMLTLFGAEDRVMRGQGGTTPGTTSRIEGVGHMPQMEAATVVNALIASFLRAND